MFYPTLRAILTALLGIPVALAIAMFAPGSWQAGYVFGALLLLLFLIDVALAKSTNRLRIALDLPASIAIGRTQALELAVRFPQKTPQIVEIVLDADSKLAVHPIRQLAVCEGDLAKAWFELTPKRRGTAYVERLWLRWRSPMGLAYIQHVQDLSRPVAVVPGILAVKEEAARLFQRDRRGGSHLNLDIRQGSEFHALRDWLAGISRRSIDWKQTARHGKLLAREFQAENNLNLYFALDTGRLMCEPLAGLPRIDRALQTTLLLAYVGLRLGDNVGLYAFGERPVLNSGLLSGTNAFAMLQQLSVALDYSTDETNFTLGLTELSAKLKRRSIIIVFTEFADITSAELMLENISRLLQRHSVLFVAFQDEEVEAMLQHPPRNPDDISRTIIADAILLEREKVIRQLQRQGAHVIDTSYDKMGMRLIETYLKLKREEQP